MNRLIKKTIILGLIAAFGSATNLSAQKPILKSVDHKDFQQKDHALSLQKRVYTEYNRFGKMIKQEFYEKNGIGQLIRQKSIQFRENKKQDFQLVLTYDSLGVLLFEELLTFDKSGRKVQSHYSSKTDNDAVSFYSTYEYNKQGKNHKTTIYNFANEVVGRESRKYNEHGEEVYAKYWKFKNLQSGLKVESEKETIYDESGAMTQTVSVVKEGASVFREVIKFEQNMIAEWMKYSNGTLTSHYVRGSQQGAKPLNVEASFDYGEWATDTEYDDFGNKVKTTYLENGKTTQVNYYSYDDNTNLTSTRKVFYQADGTERTEEDIVTYDEYNNIVRKATMLNGEVLVEQIFKYEYHNQ